MAIKDFVVNADTRILLRNTGDKTSLMQYDHNSEIFTFEVPLTIEGHDMSTCSVVQIHYENTSTGTSASTRRTYRGAEVIDNVTTTTNDAGESVITFSWTVPNTATTYAGKLKFQLKFISYDSEVPDAIAYAWHTSVNEDISITAGLAFTDEEMTPATTATLQSLEIEDLENGIDVILDGQRYTIHDGEPGSSGVYVGSGDMPEDCNVQIDPNGTDATYSVTQTIDSTSTENQIVSAKAVFDYIEIAAAVVETKMNKTTAIDGNSTDDEYPSAKAVYDLLNSSIAQALTTDVEV